MSKRRGRSIYNLEPEGEDAPPATSTKRVRPAAGQKPPTLDEALASVALTVGVRLIERLLAPSPPTARPLDYNGGVTTLRTCGGSHYLCGARPVLDHWKFCPYCATELRAVPS